MEKQYQAKSVVALPFSIEFFSVTGSTLIEGNKSIIFTKITTSFGKNTWNLLHQN